MKKKHVIILLSLFLLIITGCSRVAKEAGQQTQTVPESSIGVDDTCKKILPDISVYCPNIGDAEPIFISPDHPSPDNISYSGTGTGACIWTADENADTEDMRALMLTVDFYPTSEAAAEALTTFAQQSKITLDKMMFTLEDHMADGAPLEHQTQGRLMGKSIMMLRQFASKPNNFFCPSTQSDKLIASLNQQLASS